MAKSAGPILIKSRKGFPLAFMAIFFAVTILIIWPISLFMLFLLVTISLLLIAFFADTYSGYLKLDQGLLTRKSLLSTSSVKVSEIRELRTTGSGIFPTSSLSAGTIELGNAKDGTVGIKLTAFKKEELAPLIKRLHGELKPVNPKRANDLQKMLTRYYPESSDLDKIT